MSIKAEMFYTPISNEYEYRLTLTVDGNDIGVRLSARTEQELLEKIRIKFFPFFDNQQIRAITMHHTGNRPVESPEERKQKEIDRYLENWDDF